MSRRLSFDDMAKMLEASQDHTKDAIKLGMERVNIKISNVARMRAPFITGYLRRSVWASWNSITAKAWYAARVHENSASEGYRFLESAIQEAAGSYADDVAKAAKPDWTPDKPKDLTIRDPFDPDYEGDHWS